MPRLVADKMLIKLARWLRLCGIDVQDVPYTDDLEIIRFMKKNGGILLTMDRALAKRSKKSGFRVLLVKGDTLEKQLAYVEVRLGVKIRLTAGMLCTLCNSKLIKVGKKAVKGKVPDAVFKRYRVFYICRNCGKVYWMGSHLKRIKSRIKRAKRIGTRLKSYRVVD